MKKILVIGIGAGNPDYITMQAVNALNRTDVFFILDKGPAKEKLTQLRKDICERYIQNHEYRFVEATLPERTRGVADYHGAVVDLNLAKEALFEQLINEQLAEDECGAFLVWGDPSLYDSTIRILNALIKRRGLQLEYEVIPGITSIQALTAQHKVPLNEIGDAVEITTGRRLAERRVHYGSNMVVMLDAENSYQCVPGDEYEIYWGAYIGTPDQILMSGRVDEVKAEIDRVRAEAREKNGWIMDTYLLKRI
ncbi:precorrin-6A synthase (deacetylating) [Amantichitinum ursilacus]|uniref:Cobalt-precorrin-2 C(20)-methyltransferase n=1 Tax=Amantichitinum ursilacus TaxID=857265 RepID=A0A0N0GNA0_9NEIS|nr:precorrin-6A synthase (deacetylating) [Amantichitinum ursilacus]KPC52515.1 Cobalt-precorrin-2 C(20)-methyltransferase [Amantichitinum ursilacus]